MNHLYRPLASNQNILKYAGEVPDQKEVVKFAQEWLWNDETPYARGVMVADKFLGDKVALIELIKHQLGQ